MAAVLRRTFITLAWFADVLYMFKTMVAKKRNESTVRQLGVLDVAVGRRPAGTAVALFFVVANLLHKNTVTSDKRLQLRRLS